MSGSSNYSFSRTTRYDNYSRSYSRSDYGLPHATCPPLLAGSRCELPRAYPAVTRRAVKPARLSCRTLPRQVALPQCRSDAPQPRSLSSAATRTATQEADGAAALTAPAQGTSSNEASSTVRETSLSTTSTSIATSASSEQDKKAAFRERVRKAAAKEISKGDAQILLLGITVGRPRTSAT